MENISTQFFSQRISSLLADELEIISETLTKFKFFARSSLINSGKALFVCFAESEACNKMISPFWALVMF